MYCKRDYEIRKRTIKGCRKYKQKKTKKKTKQSRTKQSRTKKNFSKKSQKITSRIRPDLEEDSSDEEDAHIPGYVEPTAENIYDLQGKSSETSQRKPISPNIDTSVKEKLMLSSYKSYI